MPVENLKIEHLKTVHAKFNLDILGYYLPYIHKSVIRVPQTQNLHSQWEH